MKLLNQARFKKEKKIEQAKITAISFKNGTDEILQTYKYLYILKYFNKISIGQHTMPFCTEKSFQVINSQKIFQWGEE